MYRILFNSKLCAYNVFHLGVLKMHRYVKALAAGKTSAPFPSTILAGQSEITFWTGMRLIIVATTLGSDI